MGPIAIPIMEGSCWYELRLASFESVQGEIYPDEQRTAGDRGTRPRGHSLAADVWRTDLGSVAGICEGVPGGAARLLYSP